MHRHPNMQFYDSRSHAFGHCNDETMQGKLFLSSSEPRPSLMNGANAHFGYQSANYTSVDREATHSRERRGECRIPDSYMYVYNGVKRQWPNDSCEFAIKILSGDICLAGGHQYEATFVGRAPRFALGQYRRHILPSGGANVYQ